MKKKIMLILSCLLMFVGYISAQKTVKGVVVDEVGASLPGVSVVVKGTTTGVATDDEGGFIIRLPEGKNTLVFKLVGMKALELSAKDEMSVVMREDNAMLEEVVVTGFGSMKKSSFTGSAAVVSNKDMENIPGISVQSRLAGAAAGVQLGSTSGQPGAMESIRIRGTGSINASNEPLYVIDGVPMLNEDVAGFNYSKSGNSMLSTINANDIESMTIIKDAGAAALYGSRASNGVVVITTKTGKSGRNQVNIRADWGFSNMAVDYRPVLKGDARREMLYMGLTNQGQDLGKPDPIAYADGLIDNYAAKPWSGWQDWKKKLIRTGTSQNYEANIQGGNDKTTYYTSLAYTKMEGISRASDYDRFAGRVNLSQKVNDRLNVNVSMMFTRAKQTAASEGTAYDSPIMQYAMVLSPQDYPYNEDGTLNVTKKFGGFPNGAISNPLQTMKYNHNKSVANRFMASAGARYEVYDGLSISETFNYDLIKTDNDAWWDPRTSAAPGTGVKQKYNLTHTNLTSQTRLNYVKTFDKVHNISALFGYEVEKYKKEITYASGTDFPNPNLPEIGNAANNNGDSEYTQHRMISYLGALNYNYDNRYYLDGSFRRDGSTKFARNKRWGNFWSVAGSWRLSEEAFMASAKRILTDAKIRVSYGVNGNLPIEEYGHLDLYTYGAKYAGSNGAAITKAANPDLTWEKNNTINVALEATFLDRFSFEFEFYNKDTKDLLIDRPVSMLTGYQTVLMNLGKMNNKGVELTLKSENIITKDFQWRSSLNLAHNKNKLKKLDGLQNEMILGYGEVRQKVGQDFNTIYTFEYAGVDPETGKESYYKNKPGSGREITTDISEANQVYLKKVTPTIQGGITNNFKYKDFDLGFTFTYSLGGHFYDRAGGRWLGKPGGGQHYLGAVAKYWKPGDVWQKPGDNAKLPKYSKGAITPDHSSRFMKSTDHLRLKNITLGYVVPKALTRKLHIEKARVFASAANLFTWKKSDVDTDPELPISNADGAKTYGVVQYETPSLRTITFGFELSF